MGEGGGNALLILQQIEVSIQGSLSDYSLPGKEFM
jgi:hypothetical protein